MNGDHYSSAKLLSRDEIPGIHGEPLTSRKTQGDYAKSTIEALRICHPKYYLVQKSQKKKQKSRRHNSTSKQISLVITPPVTLTAILELPLINSDCRRTHKLGNEDSSFRCFPRGSSASIIPCARYANDPIDQFLNGRFL